ncbi:phage regulatory CII family protein [Vogesella oryzae]|uniref:phage regulatory CII family protein n=1 Tax=Vogesella oryzae TaxID=1735285 RepID=UPI001582215C|nr:phage regulatory CII family protein [Vogesella oryzae]
MDVLSAARGVASRFPGGIAGLAAAMGMSAKVLANKLNPHNDTHHLRLDEALEMSVIANDPAVLFAYAEQLGFVCMPATFGKHCEGSPLRALSGFMAAQGDVGEAINLALDDDRIDLSELADIEEAVLQSIRHSHGVLDAVRAAHKRGLSLARA